MSRPRLRRALLAQVAAQGERIPAVAAAQLVGTRSRADLLRAHARDHRQGTLIGLRYELDLPCAAWTGQPATESSPRPADSKRLRELSGRRMDRAAERTTTCTCPTIPSCSCARSPESRSRARTKPIVAALRPGARPYMSDEQQPVRVGVVGLGYWGPNLARNFAAIPGCELAWLCDRDEQARAQARARVPGRTRHRRARRAARRRRARRGRARHARAHARRARRSRSLEAGKHCFVEKPLATTAADAERAVAAAERAGKILMVGHLLEYHPAVARLKELIDSDELGEALLHLRQPPQPRQAARRRERAVEPRRARRVRRAAPDRRRARRVRRPRRQLRARGRPGRRLLLPALPLRRSSRTCTCRGSTRTRSGASPSSARAAWPRSTTC